MASIKLIAKSALILTFSVLGTMATAGTITYFSSTTQVVDAGSTGCSAERECAGALGNSVQLFSADGNSVSDALGDDFAEGSASTSGEANLETGELKSSASVDAADVPANGSLFAFSRADYGDSFRTFEADAETPFTWANDTEVTFSLDISGSVDLGTGATNGSTVFFAAYAPGDLDLRGQFLQAGTSVGLPPLPQPFYSEAYALGQNNENDGASFLDGTLETFPQTLDITFAPGGDFDWILGLITFTRLDTTAFPDGFGTIDFSNTISTTYVGPDGAVTTSASGVFPGTQPQGSVDVIPLPAGLPLLLAGLGGFAILRRWSSAKL